jgi:hypothetical protein
MVIIFAKLSSDFKVGWHRYTIIATQGGLIRVNCLIIDWSFPMNLYLPMAFYAIEDLALLTKSVAPLLE